VRNIIAGIVKKQRPKCHPVLPSMTLLSALKTAISIAHATNIKTTCAMCNANLMVWNWWISNSSILLIETCIE